MNPLAHSRHARHAYLPVLIGILLLIFGGAELGISQPSLEEASTAKLLTAIAKNTTEQLPLSLQRRLLEVHYLNQVNRHGRVLERLRVENGISSLDDVRAEVKWSEIYYKAARGNVEVTRLKNKIGRGVLKGLEIVPIKDPVTSLGIKALSKLSDPMMRATENVVNWTVDFGVSKAFTPDVTAERIRDFARVSVLDAKGSVDAAKLREATSFFTPTFVNNPAFRKLDEKQQAELTRAMQVRIETVIDQQGEKISDIFERMRLVEGDAKTAVELIGKTKELVREASKRQQEFAGRVQQNQQAINKSLETLKTGIEQNRDLSRINNRIAASSHFKLEVMMSVMYDELPTDRKLEWVKNEYVQLPPDVRTNELAILERRKIVEHQVAISKGVEDYLNKGREILGIAAALKLPPDAIKAAEKGIRVAETANGVFKNFATGNYLGAISSIAGLFGGGGPDVGEIRHRQLMEQFGQVNKKLDALQQGQQAILEVVAGIDQKINELSRIVLAQHEEVIKQLAAIESRVLWNTALLDQVLRQNLDSCREFLRIREKRSYREMQDFFNNNSRGFDAGELMISSSLSGIDPINGDGWARLNKWFFMRTRREGDEKDKVIDEMEAQFAALTSMLTTNYPSEASTQLAWSCLAVPAASNDLLDAKVSVLSSTNVSALPMPYEMMNRLLNPQAVGEFSQAVASLSDYFFLVNRSVQPVRLFSSQELDSAAAFDRDDMRARREKSRRTLQFCLAVINGALAQQGLLSGDLLLPCLSETITNESTLKLLRNNQVMARNALMFEIKRRLLRNQQTVLAYEFALQSTDADYLTSLLGQDGRPHFRFEKLLKEPGTGRPLEEARWYATIGNIVLPMPTADNLRAGTLELMPTVATLATIREDLVTRIAEIDFAETIPPDHALRVGLISM